MRAGTVSAIAKTDHFLAQAWARYFYEHAEVYGLLDGLLYFNAHK